MKKKGMRTSAGMPGVASGTPVLDRYGRKAPSLDVAEIHKRPGHTWQLVERRGTVVINENGEAAAVMLSLDQFVSILFGIHRRQPRKKSRA